MKFISHRGNLNGRDYKIENNPVHIEMLLDCGINCEVDLRFLEGNLYLGHDSPDYKISPGFLKKKGLWVHCKNFDALFFCLGKDINFFWHENDDYTLTSGGYIWTFPGKEPPNSNFGVIVDLEKGWGQKNYQCLVCSDYES